jgi:hypothetical protein
MITIVSVEPVAGAEFHYGPPDSTRLALTVVADDGMTLPLVLEEQAVRQLAILLSQIQGRFPGAFKGH